MSNKNSNEDFLNKIVHLMQADRSEDAPQDSIKWAKDIFRTRAAEPKKSLAQKVLAVLQLDLSPGAAVFGERSASSTAPARQMLFGAGENSIDLRVTKTEKGTLDIYGQILGEGFANCRVALGEFDTVANELSEFKLAEIPAGVYKLVFRTNEREIIVEALNLD